MSEVAPVPGLAPETWDAWRAAWAASPRRAWRAGPDRHRALAAFGPVHLAVLDVAAHDGPDGHPARQLFVPVVGATRRVLARGPGRRVVRAERRDATIEVEAVSPTPSCPACEREVRTFARDLRLPGVTVVNLTGLLGGASGSAGTSWRLARGAPTVTLTTRHTEDRLAIDSVEPSFWDQVRTTRSGRSVRRVRYGIRKVLGADGVELRRFGTGPADAEAFVRLAQDLWPRTWQSDRLAPLLGSRNEAVARALAEAGGFRGFALVRRGAPLAIALLSVWDDSATLELLYHDRDQTELTPGKSLLYCALDELFQAGVRHVDFGPGTYQYKDELATHRRRGEDQFTIRLGWRTAPVAAEQLVHHVRTARGHAQASMTGNRT